MAVQSAPVCLCFISSFELNYAFTPPFLPFHNWTPVIEVHIAFNVVLSANLEKSVLLSSYTESEMGPLLFVWSDWDDFQFLHVEITQKLKA